LGWVYSLTALLEPLVDEGSLRCHYLRDLEEEEQEQGEVEVDGREECEWWKKEGAGWAARLDAVILGDVMWLWLATLLTFR
jgi:hypothetical protein